MFKYSPVSKYSLMNLESHQVFLNHYSSFNDPFECMCDILMEFPALSERSGRLMNVLKAWGFDDFDEPLVVGFYDDYAASLQGGEPIVQDYIDNARIGCFSKRPDNLLMWGHYASGMRGFCLEVDEELLTSGDEAIQMYSVIYDDKPAAIDASVLAVLYDQLEYHSNAAYEVKVLAEYHGVDRSGEIDGYKDWYLADLDRVREIYQKMLATKPVAWKYEEELRLIKFSPGGGNVGIALDYPANAVKSLILGQKIEAENLRKLLDIFRKKHPDVPIKQAVTEPGSFDIQLVEYSY